MPKTALETFWEQIPEILPFSVDSETAIKLYEKYQQAKQMEREQHGDTWDEAIKAHEKRGNVIARSICDFDEYYTQTYGNKEPKDVVLGYKTSLDAQMLDKVGLKTK